MKPILSLVVALLISTSWLVAAAANDEQQTALSRLQQQRLSLPVSLQFSQARYLHALPRPLNSHGELHIDEQQIVWQTLQPQPARLVIDAQGVRQQDSEPQPGSEQVAKILLAILQQQQQQLQANFLLTLSSAQCVRLTPKDNALQQFVRYIDSCGEDFPAQITLFEQNGNRTELQLSRPDA
ncbi:LolA family protein [Idiomarina xiamenensis]|uniref:LolA family outer membrane lipoprotein-sorting protein n=1 Tax=Idiomarina xiamenensis 10-D-4 TaxID=740709 RepID=K2JJ21_9GAMM|nr:outer membrane lipoprotein carrier protein LolA [Idiomarina xiamenensis]EKE83421.1 LolA family outer membrane lipoprotein-sorting protein [Idiomarina xiamenensis 10-D-4]